MYFPLFILQHEKAPPVRPQATGSDVPPAKSAPHGCPMRGIPVKRGIENKLCAIMRISQLAYANSQFFVAKLQSVSYNDPRKKKERCL